MAIKTITSNGGILASADFKEVTITGKTKGGQPVRIFIENALNMGNLEWTFAEKNEVVPAIEFEACYATQMRRQTKQPHARGRLKLTEISKQAQAKSCSEQLFSPLAERMLHCVAAEVLSKLKESLDRFPPTMTKAQ